MLCTPDAATCVSAMNVVSLGLHRWRVAHFVERHRTVCVYGLQVFDAVGERVGGGVGDDPTQPKASHARNRKMNPNSVTCQKPDQDEISKA